MKRIVIIDYGMGNLRSVEKSIRRFSNDVVISNKTEDISCADKLVLPGVGHFKKGMDNLQNMRIIEVLNKKVLIDKTPIIGICLGMQLMTRFSEEGMVHGLNWINTNTLSFKNFIKLKVPHVGWNTISNFKNSKVLNGINNFDTFYFVHSYFVEKKQENFEICYTNYGFEFCSGFNEDNIYGFQFHPEKSLNSGMKLINNFVDL
jgi:glutamine amidotransferase